MTRRGGFVVALVALGLLVSGSLTLRAGQAIRFASRMPEKPPEQHFPAYAPRVPSEFRASLLQVPILDDENLLSVWVNLHPTLPAVIALDGRLWSDAERRVKFFQERTTVAPNGGVSIVTTMLERGALLSLIAHVETANIRVGDFWSQVLMTHGSTGSRTFTKTLIQGYVSFFDSLDWPGSPIQSLHTGKGAIRTVLMNDLGSAMDITVPADRRWRVITGSWLLNLGASALNKYVIAQLFDGVPNQVYIGISQPQQAALANDSYALVPGGLLTPPAGQPVHVVSWPPDLELLPGYRLQLTTNPPEVTDNFNFGALLVREWYAP